MLILSAFIKRSLYVTDIERQWWSTQWGSKSLTSRVWSSETRSDNTDLLNVA